MSKLGSRRVIGISTDVFICQCEVSCTRRRVDDTVLRTVPSKARHVGLRCSGGNPHARTGPAKASGACGFALLGGNPPARTGPARQGRRSILWLLRRAGRVGLRCLEATHMRTLDLQSRAMVENTTITKPGSKGDIEVAVEPETPDLEGEVKSTVLDGSTIPTALKRAICLEGSVTEDVTPTRALSRLLRKSSTGEVIGASRGVRMAKSEMLRRLPYTPESKQAPRVSRETRLPLRLLYHRKLGPTITHIEHM
nr:hypothetical protein Iba_chr05cCG12900 [Ipomoea batatas]